MTESERTYYGTDDPEERRILMREERRPGVFHPSINPCISRALSGRHILLIGSTGSGKTYAAGYMTKFMDAFLFVNTQAELSVTKMCQIRLEDPSELGDALENGYRKIEFIPSMDRESAQDEVEVLREQLFEIGSVIKEQANALELPFWFNFFLDEAQVYSPKHAHKNAEIFWTQGRGFGIKSIAITRSPTELSSEVINNCEYELIFQLGMYSYPYYKTYHIPIEEEKEWLARKHHFLLWDKTNITRCYPI